MIDLQSMTVVALRQFAKENQITLGTGLSKAEIIHKIQSALNNSPTDLQKESTATHTGSEAISSREKAEKEAKEEKDSLSPPIKPGPHNDIVYSATPAWQARSSTPKSRSGSEVKRSQGGLSPMRFGPGSTTAPTRFGPESGSSPSLTRFGPSSTSVVSVLSQGNENVGRKTAAPPPTGQFTPKTVAGPTPSFSELTVSELLGDGKGILEVLPDGFGFLRDDSFSSSPKDIYVSNAQIKRFSLRTGDQVEGRVRLQKDGERYSALIYITSINGQSPEEQTKSEFAQFIPTYPNRLIPLKESLTTSFAQTFALSQSLAPLGFGQRSLIVGENFLFTPSLFWELKEVFDFSQEENHAIIGICLNQSPEDAAELKAHFPHEFFVSSFEQTPDVHIRVTDLALGRAQRLVENGKDVLLFVDNIGALALAYQSLSLQNIRGSATALSPSALSRTMQFLGAARNTSEKGSLSIISTFYLKEDTFDQMLLPYLVQGANNTLFFRYSPYQNRYYMDLEKSMTKKAERLLSKSTLQVNQILKQVFSNLSSAEIENFYQNHIFQKDTLTQSQKALASWIKKLK